MTDPHNKTCPHCGAVLLQHRVRCGCDSETGNERMKAVTRAVFMVLFFPALLAWFLMRVVVTIVWWSVDDGTWRQCWRDTERLTLSQDV